MRKTWLTYERLKKCIEFQPLIVHYCTFCKYPCSYIVVDGILGYDSGCDCVTTEYKKLNAGWQPISRHAFEAFMRQQDMRYILLNWCDEVEAKIENEMNTQENEGK